VHTSVCAARARASDTCEQEAVPDEFDLSAEDLEDLDMF